MKTLVVNLFGGPGCGKSTFRAALFHCLKTMQMDVEEVPEFAKDLVWSGRERELAWQPTIFGEQYRRMKALEGQAGIIVTDSPLLLQALYCYRNGGLDQNLIAPIAAYAASFNNFNCLLRYPKRNYTPAGRTQTEDEAKSLHWDTERLLNSFVGHSGWKHITEADVENVARVSVRRLRVLISTD